MYKTLSIIAILSTLGFTVAAEARMYQWVDQESGTTQLSGKPPSWYRSGQPGPRIFVFESGQLVDDTGIRVSDEQRELLRQRSYQIANDESIEEKARSILAKDNRRVEEPSAASEEEQEAEAQAVAAAETEDEAPEGLPSEVSEMTLDDMKQLILDWEKVQEDRAKEIINQQP